MQMLVRWCLLGTLLLSTASARISSISIEELTVAGPDPRYDFIKSVELTYLEGLIRKQQRAAK